MMGKTCGGYRGLVAAGVACAALLLGACKPEEKMVRYKPFFSGLDGVQTETEAVLPVQSAPLAAYEESESEIENDDGSTTLVIKTGVQLMAHIRRLLAEDEAELFTDQVLSEITRREYRERGLDPQEAFRTLKTREKDIQLLFSRMPMGEHSPNVTMQPIGKNFFRVRLTGQATRGLGRYRGFDMVLEKGHWRLRWFV